MASETKTVGLIGLGLMGQALATRLIPAGFRVLGYDIDAAKGTRLKATGGEAASLADVAKCGTVLLAVFSTDQVEDVTENTLVPAAGGGKIVLCTSTCDPDRIATLAARVEPKGIRFLETPVSGSSGQVSRGEGTGLIGGDPATAAEVDDILTALYPRRFHIGKAGDAGRAKLAINLILGLNRMALAEGIVFASRLGLDAKAFLDVARASAAYSQVMDIKGRKMVEREFKPEGFVHQSLKDFALMHDQASKLGQTLPALELNKSLLEACVRAGEADYDNSAVIEEIRRRYK
ncbi:MAG: NAD(P)-dependent oxidoreductase [Xanthobacteraceae bacterium]|jgi:putative dehydrogenase